MKSPSNDEGRIVASAIKSEAPLVGAPAEYLPGEDGQPVVREKKIPLKFPFRLEGVEYREVTARRLNGGDIFRINNFAKKGNDAQTAMFAVMCRIPVAAIEALDAEDLTALTRASADFTRQLVGTDDEPTGNDGENTSQK